MHEVQIRVKKTKLEPCDMLKIAIHTQFKYQVLQLTRSLGYLRIPFSYRKIASSDTSCLEAHAGFFRLLMKGIFDPYVL